MKKPQNRKVEKPPIKRKRGEKTFNQENEKKKTFNPREFKKHHLRLMDASVLKLNIITIMSDYPIDMSNITTQLIHAYASGQVETVSEIIEKATAEEREEFKQFEIPDQTRHNMIQLMQKMQEAKEDRLSYWVSATELHLLEKNYICSITMPPTMIEEEESKDSSEIATSQIAQKEEEEEDDDEEVEEEEEEKVEKDKEEASLKVDEDDDENNEMDEEEIEKELPNAHNGKKESETNLWIKKKTAWRMT